MDSWLLLDDGAYTNAKYIVSLYPSPDPDNSGNWLIGFVSQPAWGGTGSFLAGDYPDEATARAAIKDLVNGTTVAEVLD